MWQAFHSNFEATKSDTESKQKVFRIIQREEWNATNSKKQLEVINLPVENFIIHHTVTLECDVKVNLIK